MANLDPDLCGAGRELAVRYEARGVARHTDRYGEFNSG